MVNYFTSTAAFMTAVAGEWANPVTGTCFCFVPAPTAIASGTVIINSGDKGRATSFHFTAQLREDNIILITETHNYPVWIIGGQVQSMAIALSNGELLQLVKRQ